MTIKLKRSIVTDSVTVTLNKIRETQKAVMLRYSIFVKPLNKTFNLKSAWIPKSMIVSDGDDYIELQDTVREIRKDWLDELPDVIISYSVDKQLYQCAYCRENIQFPQLLLVEFKGSEVKNVYAFCSWMCLFDASGCEISEGGEKE
ncbi:MAG: hypothetical protein NDF57_05175 [archaeon GBS-70-058]|nr:hypothetical protein [Candidatus Culexarchaeum nevadense]